MKAKLYETKVHGINGGESGMMKHLVFTMGNAVYSIILNSYGMLQINTEIDPNKDATYIKEVDIPEDLAARAIAFVVSRRALNGYAQYVKEMITSEMSPFDVVNVIAGAQKIIND
jgi:hypothetical protein